MSKICTKCGIEKPLLSFHRQSKARDGHVSQCKECRNATHREYYKNNPEAREKKNSQSRRWNREHPENIPVIIDWRRRKRKETEPTLKERLNKAISGGICRSLKGKKNGYHWERLVDYTQEELRTHLESLWEPWMNWNNYGQLSRDRRTWQIDHIRPVSSFNITSVECVDFQKCWALENLQPLCAFENLLKGNTRPY